MLKHFLNLYVAKLIENTNESRNANKFINFGRSDFNFKNEESNPTDEK